MFSSRSTSISPVTVRTRRSALWWQLPISWVLAVLAVAAAGATIACLPLLYLAAVTPELVRIDVENRRLPNRLVLPGVAVSILYLAAGWLVTGIVPLVPLAAGGGYSVFLLIFALAGEMGMGDVKLSALLGLCSFDAAVALASPVFAFLLGGIAGLVVLGTGRRHARLPFGPFLLAGLWLALLAQLLYWR